ncbi:MAG TPA: PilZ domain-containing protein [Polyangiaceae bacterium]
MEKKDTPTPPEGVVTDASGPNASARTRRTDARRGVSEKITIRALGEGDAPGAVVSIGWALNISRSGLRAISEERLSAGVDYEVTIGDEGTTQLTRRVRTVWVQEEHDGFVVGLEFLNASQSGEHPALDKKALTPRPPSASLAEPDSDADDDEKA